MPAKAKFKSHLLLYCLILDYSSPRVYPTAMASGKLSESYFFKTWNSKLKRVIVMVIRPNLSHLVFIVLVIRCCYHLCKDFLLNIIEGFVGSVMISIKKTN